VAGTFIGNLSFTCVSLGRFATVCYVPGTGTIHMYMLQDSVVDLDSLNPELDMDWDPAFQVKPDPGF